MALLPVGCMSLSDTEFFLRCNCCSTHAVHLISRHVLQHAQDIEPYGAHIARSLGSMGSGEGVLCNICAVQYAGADPDWWRQTAWVRLSHEAYQAVDWTVWPRWPRAEVDHEDHGGRLESLERRLSLIELSLNTLIHRLPATRTAMGSVGSVVASNKDARKPW
jgi:hypothetical protein